MTDARDHRISLQQAIAMTHTYQRANPGQTNAWWFHRLAFDALLAEPNAMGVRIYLGTSDLGPSPVVCPTDADRNDLVDGYLAELAFPCPPYCAGSKLMITEA